MKLCKYFDEYGLDVLKNYRLKVTDPTKFNDPFEFLPSISGVLNRQIFKRYLKNRSEFENISYDEAYEKFKEQFPYPNNLRLAINNTREKLRNLIRVLCFSNFELIKPQEDILMWGHYTNSHSGLRITFDINKIKLDFLQLVKIEYEKKRTQIDLNDIFIDKNKVYEKLTKSLTEKCELWCYEHEYRLLIKLSECDRIKANDKTLDYIKISPDTVLRVDIGINAGNKFKKNVREILDNQDFSHTEVKFAKTDDTEYKINYTEQL